jgi:hypothetical protein
MLKYQRRLAMCPRLAFVVDLAAEMAADQLSEMLSNTTDLEPAAFANPAVPTLRDVEPHELRTLLKSSGMLASEAAELYRVRIAQRDPISFSEN